MNGAGILMLVAAALFPSVSAGEQKAAERSGGNASEFRLYGRADLNVTRYQNRKGVPFLAAGLWDGSRLGARGGLYLGAGLKPVFRLESGIGTEKGNLELMQGGRLFGRQAYIGLETALGTVTVGRLYPASDPIVDLVDIALPGLLSSYKSQFYWQFGRLENAALYTSPSMGGLQARLGYALGEKGDALGGSTLTTGLMYNSQALAAGASLESLRTSAFGASSVYNFWNLAASYDLGAVALVAGYSSDDLNLDLSVQRAIKSKTYALGATLTAGAAGKVVSLVQVVKPENAAALHIASLRYAHSLAQGASLYAQINLADYRAAQAYGRKNEVIVGLHYRFDVLVWGR